MNKGVVIIIAFIIAGVACQLMHSKIVIEIGPRDVGVRLQKCDFLGKKGIYQKDYDEAGTYRNIPFVDKWYVFDKTAQTLSFTERDLKTLAIMTADGYKANVYLDVKYRIKPGEAHLLVQVLGPNFSIVQSKIKNETVDKARIVLGAVNSEEFENPAVLKAKSSAMLEKMRAVFSYRHIEILSLEIKGVEVDSK